MLQTQGFLCRDKVDKDAVCSPVLSDTIIRPFFFSLFIYMWSLVSNTFTLFIMFWGVFLQIRFVFFQHALSTVDDLSSFCILLDVAVCGMKKILLWWWRLFNFTRLTLPLGGASTCVRGWLECKCVSLMELFPHAVKPSIRRWVKSTNSSLSFPLEVFCCIVSPSIFHGVMKRWNICGTFLFKSSCPKLYCTSGTN